MPGSYTVHPTYLSHTRPLKSPPPPPCIYVLHYRMYSQGRIATVVWELLFQWIIKRQDRESAR